MSRRRKNDVMDPDYRRAGWSKSQYAPKNSGNSITNTAKMYSALLLGAVGFGLYAIPPVRTGLSEIPPLTLLIAGGIPAFLLWALLTGLIGSRLRNKEFERLRRDHGLRTEAELNAPEVKARRASAQVRVRDAAQFEQEVAELITRLTGKYAVVVGGGGDGGVDIEIKESGRLVGIVQCKLYDPNKTLPPDHIRAFATVKRKAGVNVAYLVTTARFSTTARTEAESLGIRLIDGAKLEAMREKSKNPSTRQQPARRH